ncbi:glycopeptidase [Candidatus Acidianus copahuensis]|uniref:Glycopeptidase n=1 Tax=Candidatus Acidianus copahuensis TaxID=1160895 RepID=A0A031LUH4_9CREN|nr:glycopeptidase [Candidatus Acidianus copahuensis]
MRKLAITLIVVLTLAFSLPGLAVSPSVSNSSFHALITNMTISSKIPFSQDPAFYSFQAYHVIPSYTNYVTNVSPVVIDVATNLLFNDTGLRPYYLKTYIPPGNYSLEVMNVSIKEFNGTQYDRQAYIFANGVPIFWGSTQEINNSTAQVDVTMFENLLQGNVTFEPVIQNYYDAKVGITGLYEMNITLYLYPGHKPVGLPNEFIPLFVNFTPEGIDFNYSYTILNPKIPSVTQQISIPNGTYRMMSLIYEEGGGLDEFWYTNEPATRSIQIYYDNYLAGIVNPYETIYTGGIDLFYWKPLTSINTLSFHSPTIIDLTPMLALGSKANVTVDVTNLLQAYQLTGSTAYDWDIAGVIMLWVNQSNPMISSKIITANNHFMDSGPIFVPSFSGEYYLEDGHYYINYESILYFKHGTEISHVIQSGTFLAKQTFNQIFQYGYMDESFLENAIESGMYNASLTIEGNYPITFTLDAIAVPITSPSVIPYNLSYEQNGTINLGLDYSMNWTFGNYSHYEKTVESLYSIGGFGGVIEIINSYGGAVLVKLTSNNALTEKNLTEIWLVNNKGFMERFFASAGQNSTVNLNGYYIKISQQFTMVPDPIPSEHVANIPLIPKSMENKTLLHSAYIYIVP